MNKLIVPILCVITGVSSAVSVSCYTKLMNNPLAEFRLNEHERILQQQAEDIEILQQKLKKRKA